MYVLCHKSYLTLILLIVVDERIIDDVQLKSETSETYGGLEGATSLALLSTFSSAAKEHLRQAESARDHLGEEDFPGKSAARPGRVLLRHEAAASCVSRIL